MNTRFENYLSALPKKQQTMAREAVEEYLKGASEDVEKIDSSDAIYKRMRFLATEETEHAYVLLAKNNFRLIKQVEISHGGLTETAMDVRVIIKEALLNNATVIAIVHNHPSGCVRPSRDDEEITKKIAEACRVMRIFLVDHVIIGDGDYYSFRDNGKL